MSEAMYQEQDREVIEMVNENARKTSRVVGVIVPSCNVAAIEQAEADLKALEAEKLQMHRIGLAAARACLGLLCIGAMARDMMSPGLAVLAALGCAVWATVGYRRSAHG